MVKLKLTICSGSKKFIYISIIRSGYIEKLNKINEYVKTICYIATSDFCSNISLMEGKNNYINGDNILNHTFGIFQDITLIQFVTIKLKECLHFFFK